MTRSEDTFLRGPWACTDADTVTRVLEHIYGADLVEPGGVVHVIAVWEETPRSYITLRVGAESPKSDFDQFVLNVARARADAIITTGQILRDEPTLTHRLQGPGASGLEAWRSERLGKREPPLVLVLTSGNNLPAEHPVFFAERPPLVYTNVEAAEHLRAALGNRATIVGTARPSLRSAIAHVQDRYAAETISIEAGPTTAQVLYEEPPCVDELMLSVYREPTLPDSIKGPAFVSTKYITEVFSMRSPVFAAEHEPSGKWCFYRYTR